MPGQLTGQQQLEETRLKGEILEHRGKQNAAAKEKNEHDKKHGKAVKAGNEGEANTHNAAVEAASNTEIHHRNRARGLLVRLEALIGRHPGPEYDTDHEGSDSSSTSSSE